MTLTAVLLILLAEALVLLAIALLLRMGEEQDHFARCVRNFARRTRVTARRSRERNDLPIDVTTVTGFGAG